MRLSVQERFKLLELIPEKSTYAGVKEFIRANALLTLTEEEAEELDVKFVDGMIQFNPEKAMGLIVDVPMGEWMTNIFRTVLREKDHEGDLQPAEASLFEKFIMDYE